MQSKTIDKGSLNSTIIGDYCSTDLYTNCDECINNGYNWIENESVSFTSSDNLVSFLMFIFATLITLLALYIVFEINPAHYQL